MVFWNKFHYLELIYSLNFESKVNKKYKKIKVRKFINLYFPVKLQHNYLIIVDTRRIGQRFHPRHAFRSNRIRHGIRIRRRGDQVARKVSAKQ